MQSLKKSPPTSDKRSTAPGSSTKRPITANQRDRNRSSAYSSEPLSSATNKRSAPGSGRVAFGAPPKPSSSGSGREWTRRKLTSAGNKLSSAKRR